MTSAKIKSSGYENVVVDCPLCNHELILNRATDLGTFEIISGTDVLCHECGRRFWIYSDSANEHHEALIYDCHNLLKTKRYMNCVLNICQAYEMFFSLYLRVKLLYVPFGIDMRRNSKALCQLNQLSDQFARKTRSLGFSKMRGVFLHLAVKTERPSGFDESRGYIDALPLFSLPEDSAIQSLSDNKISELLIRVKRTRINELRNKVVHKRAYRPKRSEAEDAVEEAKEVLFPLTSLLDLHDEPSWYFSDGH